MLPGSDRHILLFVNQHYRPDVAATGQILSDLAEHLSAEGHAVEVACARGKYQSGHLDSPGREVLNGVRVRRYWTPGAGRRSHAGRIVDYLAFYVQVAGRMLVGPRPSIVVLLTTPPLLPVLAAACLRVRRTPFVIWSMDLHPEAEFAAGMLREAGAAGRFLSKLAGQAYMRAARVVVLGLCMRQRVLEHGVRENHVATVPVWPAQEVAPVERHLNPLATEVGIGADDFVVMYSGNAGLAHEFGPLLEAARALDGQVRFLFVGDGPRRPEIEMYAREHRLTDLSYRDYSPRETLSESLSLGDVHFVSLLPEFEGIAVPAKLYGIMAAARPVLFLGPGSCTSARTILEAGCGAVVDPAVEADPAGRIAEILRAWHQQTDLCRKLGSRGRAAYLERYEKGKCCEAWRELIEELLGAVGRGARPQPGAH